MMGLSPEKAPLALLAIAAAGWYAAARSAVFALGGNDASPGRRAIGYALPVLVTAITAVVLGKSEVAVGVIFASSAAAFTLVLGIVTLASAHTHAVLPRRTWAFLLPVALICLLIGFNSGLKSTQAWILALEGLALLSFWNDPTAPKAKSLTASTSPARIILFLLAIVAAIIAAWAGVKSATDISRNIGLAGAGLTTALMLGPALVLPMIGSGSALAHEGRYDEAITSQIGFVMINLCAVLPLATALWLSRPTWQPPIETAMVKQVDAPATSPATQPAIEPPEAFPYPMAVWRVDTVFLVAVGLLLLPVSQGKWTLGKIEGFTLIFTYMVYMALMVVLAR